MLVAMLPAACGGGSANDGPDAAPPADAGPADFSFDRVGYINLIEAGVNGSAGWEAVYALINDRPYPRLPQAVAAEGDCVVWVRPPPPVCQPACGAEEVCDTGDVCVPVPRTAPAGRIDVDGLTAAMAFVPTALGSYDVSPYPPPDLFSDDATILAAAAGGDTPAFQMQSRGVPPLAGGPYNFTLVDGVDQEITWTAAAAAGAKIQLLLQVGWHGAPIEAALVCETADDGALTIPGSLIAELPRSSTGLEQHLSSLMRYRRVYHGTGAGRIELFVGSQLPVYFTH